MSVRWSAASDDPRGSMRPRPQADPAPEPVDPDVVHEDGVAWLVVLNGSWGYGHPTGDTKADGNPVVERRHFPAGLHWVDAETVEVARRPVNASPRLVVVEGDRPLLVRRLLPGPLSPAHFSLPSDGALVLMTSPARTASPAPASPDDEQGYDYPCPHCDKRWPSEGPRDLHVYLVHTDEVESAAAVEEADVEPSLTDA